MRKTIVSILSLSSLLACSQPTHAPAPNDAKDDEAKSEQGEESEKPKDSSVGSPLTGNPFAALLSGKLDEPGPYDAPKQSSNWDPEQPHLRVLALSGNVGELASFDPFAFGSGGGVTPIRELLEGLDELGKENQLEGLVLRVGLAGIGVHEWSTLPQMCAQPGIRRIPSRCTASAPRSRSS